MWSWIINTAGTNISDLVRLLTLVRDVHTTFQQEPTLKGVIALCSAPFYYDFLPLLSSMAQRNTIQSVKQLLYIWKKGYAYEDILESLQTINTLFGCNALHDIVLVHKFLIHSWISYCKGNTSIISLQNMIYKTLKEQEGLTKPLSAPPSSVGVGI
jgi:ATP-dependent helicase/DNAse subunit B